MSGQKIIDGLHEAIEAELTRKIAVLTARAEKAQAEAEASWYDLEVAQGHHQQILAELDAMRALAERLERSVAFWKGIAAENAVLADTMRNRATAAEAQVADLTAKLDGVRGVLREAEDDMKYCTSCHVGLEDGEEHAPGCRLAAVIAPETGKTEGGKS